MTTVLPSKRRVQLVACIWAFAIAAIIGFAAEPSTSTQFDARQGRGVYVIEALSDAGDGIAGAASHAPVDDGIALAALLAAMVLQSIETTNVTGAGDRQRYRSLLHWGRLARRGPPSLV